MSKSFFRPVDNDGLMESSFIFVKGVIGLATLHEIADSVFSKMQPVVVINAYDSSELISDSELADLRIDNMDASWVPQPNALRFFVQKTQYDNFFRYELHKQRVFVSKKNNFFTVNTVVDDSVTILSARNVDYSIDRNVAACEISSLIRFDDFSRAVKVSDSVGVADVGSPQVSLL